jgi:hypothetical protein
VELEFHSGKVSFTVQGAMSYYWKFPLIFKNRIGKCGIRAVNYYEQVLKSVLSLAFNGLLGYEGYRAEQEVYE